MQRITYPAACVLMALSKAKAYGFDIMEATGLPSGTVYPLLRRFEDAGLVHSKWETPKQAYSEARPRRRNYSLTRKGREALALAAARYQLHLEIFGSDEEVSASPA
jgi:DNA-binding PadR family transcriptional regulator